MAFNIAYLSPQTHQGKRGVASTQWSYWTLDTHATVDTAGYFNSAADLLKPADIINVTVFNTTIGTGAVSTYGPHIVNSVSAGVVDVSNVTVGVVTDSD